MFKKSGTTIVLLILTLIGLGLRIFQNPNIPAILNRDEAALAYNGFLISETGKDEFGKTFPLTLESFGDYKLPGYPYTLAIFFKFFPENDFVVRLPSVLAGTILIILSFYLAKNFAFKNKSALFFAGLIALTPVFFFYSRIAFEANVALTLLVAGLVLLTHPKFSLKKDLLASFLILLAVLFYNTPLILLPFLILALPFMRGVKKFHQWVIVSGILSVIFIVMYWKLSAIASQKSGITIFSDETLWQLSIDHYNKFSGIWQTILGNKYVFYLLQIWPRFLKSFSLGFLVTKGGTHPWHNLAQHAHIFYTTYAIFFIGAASLVKIAWKKDKKHLLIPYLLLVSLIPSVITVDSPHATRSLLFIYLFCFVGIYIFTHFSKKIISKVMLILALLIVLESVRYFDIYFLHYPTQQPSSLQVNFDNLIKKIERENPEEQVAIVDGGFGYILTAWYLKIPPQAFFDTIIKQQPDRIGFKYGQQVTHYHFIAMPEDRSSIEKILIEWRSDHWQVDTF